jgi:hypothetical protein
VHHPERVVSRFLFASAPTPASHVLVRPEPRPPVLFDWDTDPDLTNRAAELSGGRTSASLPVEETPPVTIPLGRPGRAAGVEAGTVLHPRPWPPVSDEPHDGDPNLDRWPMSLAEQNLVDRYLDTVDVVDLEELVTVAGGGRRAAAILGRRRRERAIELTRHRAFGPDLA